MYITAYFSDKGTPKTGLTPSIRIRDLSDNSLVVEDAAMSEVGDGAYKYNFATYDPTKDYFIRCDGGVALSGYDRYVTAANNDDLEMAAKLPTNYIMGSSVATDKDDEIDAIKTKTDNLPSDTKDYLDRILGLVFQNAAWEYTWSDSDNTKIGIWCYDSAANLNTHDKSTGKIAEYEANITFTSNKPTIMKIKKVS